MKVFATKVKQLSGSNYKEVYEKTLALYKNIESKSKRRPYVRSTYFNKEKVFLNLFWPHINQKNWKDRHRRMKYFPCGIDLILNTKIKAETKINPKSPNETLYRFKGITHNQTHFFVQIKENKRTKQKFLISIFPE